MIKFINDNGIVINKKDFGEADRYITIFTENFGKIVFLLKGIRKSKKRELSSVDILTLSKFTFYKKGENYTVSNFSGIDSYMEIKSNLDNLGIVLYILAVLNEVLVENNRKKSLYNITVKTLDYLKESDNKRKNYILVGYYLYYLIRDEGLKIEIGEGEFFSYEKSRFLVEGEKYSYRITQEEKDIIELFVTGKVRSIIEGRYLFEDIEKVVTLFEKYISFHLGVHLKLKNYIMGVEND